MKVRGFEKIENGVTILDTFVNEEDYKEAFEDYADYSGDKIEEIYKMVLEIYNYIFGEKK